MLVCSILDSQTRRGECTVFIFPFSLCFDLTTSTTKSGLSCVKSNGYNKDKPEQFQSLKPVFVQGSDSVESIMGGSVARVGEAAMWLLGSPQRSRSTMLVGCVPGSSNYLLQTGQASRNLHCMVVSGDLDASAFADNFLEHEIFSVKDGSMSAPAFLPALISHLLSSREHICEVRLPLPKERTSFVVFLKQVHAGNSKTLCGSPKVCVAERLHCRSNASVGVARGRVGDQ